MSALMTTITSVFSTVIEWVGTVGTTIMDDGNELMLLFIIIPVIGLAVGMFRRLLNVN